MNNNITNPGCNQCECCVMFMYFYRLLKKHIKYVLLLLCFMNYYCFYFSKVDIILNRYKMHGYLTSFNRVL